MWSSGTSCEINILIIFFFNKKRIFLQKNLSTENFDSYTNIPNVSDIKIHQQETYNSISKAFKRICPDDITDPLMWLNFLEQFKI